MAWKGCLVIKFQRKSLLATGSLHITIAHSELLYDERQRRYLWGFQIGDEGPRHQWFKLDLDPSQTPRSSGLATRFPGTWVQEILYLFLTCRKAKTRSACHLAIMVIR